MKILWTRQARNDLREIRAFIARDAPLTASAFVSKLRLSVERLREFPYSGQIVAEIGRAEI
jgi:toxin ParE1/3/4